MGERLVDILVIQPLSSVWCEYSPLHKESGYAEENRYDQPFLDLSRKLMEEKLDYHYGNENLMAKHAKVEDAKLCVGTKSYSCVIVPPACNLRSSSLSLLKDYARQGGKLVFVGSVPKYVDGVEAQVDVPGSVVVPTIRDAVSEANQLYPGRIKASTSKAERPKHLYPQPQSQGSIRYLFKHRRQRRSTCIELPDCSQVALLDPPPAAIQAQDDDGAINVTLAPAGSLVAIVEGRLRRVVMFR